VPVKPISLTAPTTLQDSREARARRQARQIGLLALIGAVLLVTLVLARTGWDPLRFADLGTRFDEGDPDGTTGYDGQFCYYIARYWGGALARMDKYPAMRYSRIVYPLLARALALGQPEMIPWMLIGINVLAHAAGTALIAYLLARINAPPGYSLLYAIWIGSLFALRLDLTEPLCFALALGAVAAYEHQRVIPAAILLALSALTKELGLVLAGGLAFYAALGRRRWRDALVIWLAPLGAYIGWVLILGSWLGETPSGYGATRLRPPLAGLAAVEDPLSLLIVVLWVALPSLLLALAAGAQMVRLRRVSLSGALMLATGGFVLVMPDFSWVDPVAMLRLGTPMLFAALLFLADWRPRLLRVALFFWGPLTLVFFLIPKLVW
jgi:hypothetical protein